MNQKNATVLVITPHDADFTTMAELLGGFFHHVERHTQLPPINSNHPPFLLIMDYTLRAESWRIYQEQGCAVLLLIPEHDDAALAYALEYSFDDYLTTPIDLRVLAHRIRRLNDLARLYSAEAAEFTQRAMVSALQETALALSSTLDLDTVFDRILIHLAIVLPYDLADVMLVEGGIARVARHRGYVENGLGDQIRQFRLKADHFPNWRTMAETAQPVIIEDIGQHDDWVVGILHEIDYITGSYLGAPFFVNGVLGGFLNLNSRQAGTYTPQHGALLEAFASQVSVALTNAHLHEEVTHHSVELEQRIRDLMVVYHTGQALTATLDLRQIYRLLYQETAAQLFGASIMRVLLFDPKTHGLRYDSLVQHGNMIEPALLPLTPEEQMALQVVVVQRTPYVQDNAVYAPLISDRKIIGVLQILHETPNYFANLEFTLLATLSNLAAIAIANAQLYLTVNSQRDEMTALYRATTALFLGEDIETLAQQIAETIVIEFNQSDCGVMLVDAQHKVIERIARAGSYAITPKATLALDGFGLVPEAVRTGQMVYASNTKLDPRYVTGDARTHSELVIPLISARGVIGVLDLQSMEREAFMEQDRRVLQAYAERVAAALENTLLLGEVRRHTAELERRVVERTQDLRAALQQERTLNEMKSRFVKTVSHQFRSPLTTIQAAKDLLNRYSERMTADERIERFETIDQSVKAMVRLLEDAITINNLTEDTVIFDPMLVDIHPLTQALVTQFAAQRGQQYRIIYTCVLPQVMATVDLELWQRMIVELLTNAVKFSPRHSLIECQLLNDGGDYLLIVSDQGMGIPEDDLERVFGIFDRGANVENVVGAGLGLMIVRQIIRRHHGDVSIRSRLGQGTTVTLRLPKIVLQDELTLSNRLS